MSLNITKIPPPKAYARRVSVWQQIKMYFGWGEFKYLPDNNTFDELAETEDNMFEPKTSFPYVICIENTSKKEEESVIFGEYENLTKDNYGNKKCIKLTSLIPNVSYVEIISQLYSKPEEFHLIRLRSEDSKQIHEPLLLTAKDCNGSLISKVVVPMLDAYQSQSSIIDIRKTFIIDGNLNIKVKILPNQKLIIYLHPISRGKHTSSFDSLANLIGYERKKHNTDNFALVG